MKSNSPHYLLFSEASQNRCSPPTWRFVLQNVESQSRFAATDSEPCDCGERLELLAVVRGLEALDGPARVTLVTKSRYVSRGIKKGLSQWRENNWCWERFGRIVPVRDCDLWQRVDRALQFHQVHCQAWQFETVEVEPETVGEDVAVITRQSRRRVDAHTTWLVRDRSSGSPSEASGKDTSGELFRRVTFSHSGPCVKQWGRHLASSGSLGPE